VPTTTNYSFIDHSVNIQHPSIGQLSLQGGGIGSITVTKVTDRTVHDLAADGSVLVSKVAGENGTIALSIQQTTDAEKWLQNWFNYIKDSATPSSEYALATITIRNNITGAVTTATGVAPQKEPDDNMQAQGQQRVWTMLAASIIKQ
jgi:hypothetical protein